MKLTRAAITLKEGQVWQFVGNTTCAFSGEEFKWSAGNADRDVERFQSLFNEELAQAGFTTSNDDNLFEESDGKEVYQVGLKITYIMSYICGNVFEYYHDTMLVKAEWQIYDPLKQEVVARIQTSGGVGQSIKKMDDVPFILLRAVRENARALLADESFRRIVLAESTAPAAPKATGPITLTGAQGAPPRAVSDVPGSVVALFTGSGMGSGFLVSSDGYLITNHHVVGAAQTVRVRWSDGFETTGQVIRSDKRRDVALVKTDPHGRQPLALKPGAPTVGDKVFAVGTPLKESLQNTVTQGIVSANRIIDGFAFIQSDVVVDHGNSGGPLLNEKGQVIGITEMTLVSDGTQRGLNAFIPIGDALDFLALKPGP